MRSRRRQFSMQWFALLSVLLHVLALLAVNLLPTPAGGPHPPQEKSSIRVFFPDTDKVGESLNAEVSSEIPSPGQKSDGSKTYMMPASEVSSVPEEERVSEPSTVQVSEVPKPPDPRPPTSISPQSTPPISHSHPAISERRNDTARKRTPAIQPQVRPLVQKQPQADQLARLPEPVERLLPNASGEDHQRDPSLGRDPQPPGSAQTWLFGRIPLLSGNDLDKYAKLPSSERGRSSRPLSGVDTVISLNTKDIRYLSYFAHI
jgi:hypothetical protein